MSDYYCGVDIGASATKVVLLDAGRTVLARAADRSGVDYRATARRLFREAVDQAGVNAGDVTTVATGYGRTNVVFAVATRTEIHCHGAGCYHNFPRAITVVDIGGQDNKVIHVGAEGRRQSFRMNRKCAAGTGAFIEEIALRLDLELGALDRLASSAKKAVDLSSFCTVFAKTEVLSHLRAGIPVEEIVRGAFASVVTRVAEMDPLDGDVVATGGVVAHNRTIVDILAERIGREVTVPPAPQFTGALGAALAAEREVRGGSGGGEAATAG